MAASRRYKFTERTGSGSEVFYSVAVRDGFTASTGQVLPDTFTVGSVEQNGETGRWGVRGVSVKNGDDFIVGTDYRTRREAADALVEADLAARRAAEDFRLKEHPITIALINSLMRNASEGYVTAFEQTEDALWRVRFEGRERGREVMDIVLDANGNFVRGTE